jgi:SCF-associated factor 1
VRDGFAQNSKQASRPLRLELPNRIHAISCGRDFTTALDDQGKVWCFNSWGRPFVYQPSSFDPTNPDNTIIQVECGWTFSAALSNSGTVFVWNPLAGAVGKAAAQRDVEFDNEPDETDAKKGMVVGDVIKCYYWTLEGVEPLRLPELPQLPPLVDGEATRPQLVKIAAGDQFIIGLTDGGHVLKIDITDINHPDAIKDLGTLFQKHLRGWEYVSHLTFNMHSVDML